jgi:uncharacterized protein (TIGR03790 family)
MLPLTKLRRAQVLFLLALLLAGCGRSVERDAAAPFDLPSLSQLADGGAERSTSATQFELLDSAPLMQSATGATHGGGQLMLVPPEEGFAWAVFALQGLPTDGSIVPLSVSVTRSAPCWIAFADFDKQRWEIVRSAVNGPLLPAAADLVSAGGACYVAVIAQAGIGNPSGNSNVSQLEVTLSADLDVPVPVLTTLSASGQLASAVPSWFSAAGSTPETGGTITQVTYNWNDGSPDDITNDPATEVSHTWLGSGPQTVTLTIETLSGKTAQQDFDFTLSEPFREMLVVYNSSIPESADLMDYYCSSRYGRGIDPAYVLGLPLADSASFTPNIDRGPAAGIDYVEEIRDPIKAFLDDPGNAVIKTNVKYLLLLKGVPHQINGINEFDIAAECSSVDSELCCIYSDTSGGPGGYPIESFLINCPIGLVFTNVARSFYYAGNTQFARGNFDVCYDPSYGQGNSGDEVAYPLDYLVGRIDAYTFDEAKLIIDRALQADTSGSGWVVFDSSDQDFGGPPRPQHFYDTMVDPVWPYIQDDAELSGEELMAAAGINVFADVTSERIISTSASVPPAVLTDGVIGYAGWGVNHSGGSWPSGNEYILSDLGWTYLPGACFSSYESFNGTAFSEPISRRGQGQICDFLRMGGTCAVGNAWEPFTLGCADEHIVFNRYIGQGDRWIEAAYKGMRLISWMEVVVGDPLCRVK